MTDREVMQMALDALDLHAKQYPHMVKGYTHDAAEALRTALAQPEKIECSRSHPHENMGSHCQLRTEIARLTNENAHLKAQPEPEPVAWMVRENFADLGLWEERIIFTIVDEGRGTPLYTAPPQRKPLIDEEIFKCINATASLDKGHFLVEFARAIEAAHWIVEEK